MCVKKSDRVPAPWDLSVRTVVAGAEGAAVQEGQEGLLQGSNAKRDCWPRKEVLQEGGGRGWGPGNTDSHGELEEAGESGGRGRTEKYLLDSVNIFKKSELHADRRKLVIKTTTLLKFLQYFKHF